MKPPAATVALPPIRGEVRAAHGTPIIRYETEFQGRVLHIEWQPGPPLEDVKIGFNAVARLIRETGCGIVLSDSNGVLGDWSELIPWIRYDFLPAALDAGLRHLVDVLPLDPANSFSVHAWREQTRGLVQHDVFSGIAMARQWLAGRLDG